MGKRKLKSNFLLFLIFLFIVIMSLSVLADIGPKPEINVNFHYEGENLTYEFYSKMLVCKDEMNFDEEVLCRSPDDPFCEISMIKIPDEKKECFWTTDRFVWDWCSGSSCKYTYHVPDKFKVIIIIPELNETYISEELEREGFYSEYDFNISKENISVLALLQYDEWSADSYSSFGIEKINIGEYLSIINKRYVVLFFISLFLTLSIEILVALIFIRFDNSNIKLLKYVLFANLLSLPVVWFIFILIGNLIIMFILSEFFALMFEAYFIYYFNKKIISLGKSFILSMIMNVTSVIIGAIILTLMFFHNFFYWF